MLQHNASRFAAQALVAVALSALTLVFSPLEVSASQATNAYMSVMPPARTVQMIGELSYFQVDVCNVENLKTARFAITYNASTLQFFNVARGSFFPASPASNFQYELDECLGILRVNMSLVGSGASVSGNGTLASFSFKVTQKPISCSVSTISFGQITLLDSSGEAISCDSVAAVCFWGSIGPDPPGQGLVTAFTNKAGGVYTLGEMVTLYAQVTYGGDPVRNKLVAFEIVNPIDNTITMGIGVTDQNGFARISFRIPEIGPSLGIWTAFSTVDLDQTTFWTTVDFRVEILPTVGGRTYAAGALNVKGSSAIYAVILASLVLSLVICRRRVRKAKAAAA